MPVCRDLHTHTILLSFLLLSTHWRAGGAFSARPPPSYALLFSGALAQLVVLGCASLLRADRVPHIAGSAGPGKHGKVPVCSSEALLQKL